MSVSYENSKPVFQGIKAAGITSLSALPETWLGLLLQQAERDCRQRLERVHRAEGQSLPAGTFSSNDWSEESRQVT